jgi:hypothetical protein
MSISGLIKEGIVEKCIINKKEAYQIKNKALFNHSLKNTCHGFLMKNMIMLKMFFWHYNTGTFDEGAKLIFY